MRVSLLFIGSVALALIAGCNSGKQEYHEVNKGVRVKDQPHEHEHGPHGGHLVELGEEEYHAEVVFDPKSSKITVYVLDSTAKRPSPIDAKEIKLDLTIAGQPKPFAARAITSPKDPANLTISSQFEVADNPDIKANIKDEEDLKGTVTATVNGKTYTGKISHEH
jgi:hypothetical protein